MRINGVEGLVTEIRKFNPKFGLPLGSMSALVLCFLGSIEAGSHKAKIQKAVCNPKWHIWVCPRKWDLSCTPFPSQTLGTGRLLWGEPACCCGLGHAHLFTIPT